MLPSKYLALPTVTGRFGPIVGWKLQNRQRFKNLLGATVRLRPPWRRAELPGAALASRGAGDALRGAGKLCDLANRDWLRSPVHSGGPSSLSPPPNRALKAAMGSSSYGAHACILGALFGVRAAGDGHLTHLRAHGSIACRKCWLLLLPTHPMQANATGGCAGTVHREETVR
jgi:hypothetical protein